MNFDINEMDRNNPWQAKKSSQKQHLGQLLLEEILAEYNEAKSLQFPPIRIGGKKHAK